MCELATEQIVEKINNSQAFSIMADSTRDKTNQEDIAIGAQFYDKTEKCIKNCVLL